jgi:hypothetical protein
LADGLRDVFAHALDGDDDIWCVAEVRPVLALHIAVLFGDTARERCEMSRAGGAKEMIVKRTRLRIRCFSTASNCGWFSASVPALQVEETMTISPG